MGSFCIPPDADAEIEGAPASPLDVVCLDANKDYIIITWKQPAVDGGSPILGYFIDKLVPSMTSVRVIGYRDACLVSPTISFALFFFNILILIFILFTYFLIVPGLRCSVGFSLVVASRGYSLVEVCRFLIAVASLVEHRL